MRVRMQLLVVFLLGLMVSSVAILNVQSGNRQQEIFKLQSELNAWKQESSECILFQGDRIVEVSQAVRENRKVVLKAVDDLANAVPNLVKATNPSVVMIELPYWAYDYQTGEETITWGGGTGVILDYEGHILTVGHITDYWDNLDSSLPSPRIRTYDGRRWDVERAATAADFHNVFGEPDVGMLKVNFSLDRVQMYPPVRLGSMSGLQYGESIVVIGHPYMLPWSVSTGVLSRIGTFEVDENAVLLQIDARINGGNSGGPVLRMDGTVIGLCSFSGVPYGGEGLNFFVPVSVLEECIPSLLEEVDDDLLLIEVTL